ncbi:hypothetical protein [Comamonas guangdongensis]|uniref:Uncharacterized protein n=1 Tax=Comamonas guangdongensis TaxID=510515 RepID=A0ABV3ZYK6_9BURK
MAGLIGQHPEAGLVLGDGEEALNAVALSAWRALGLGTSPSSPLRNLLTAQRAVERLERDRQEPHATHSGLAQFYPFR